MDLFWKRVQQQDNRVTATSVPEELEFSTTNPNPKSKRPHPEGTRTRNPKWNLEFAPKIETEPLAAQTEQINVEAVVDLLTDRRSRSGLGLVFWCWMIAAPFCVLALLGSLFTNLVWVPIWLFGLATIRTLSRQAGLLQQERIALQNSNLDNRWLGALCEALEWPNRRVQNIAGRLLTQFLPRVKEEDAHLFTDEQRTCLYRRLTPRAARTNPELALTILRALPIMGSEPGLPYVERLASRPTFFTLGGRVRAAARATLALLERRIAWSRALETVAAREQVHATPDKQPGPHTDESEGSRAEAAMMAAYVDAQMLEFEAELAKFREPGMRIGFLIASWGILVPYALVQTVLQFASRNWAGGLIFAALTVLGTQLYRLTLTARHQRIAHKLSKMDDVRCIGRLAEMLVWPDASTRHLAIAALTRLLPRVKASDNVLHTPAQRGNLHRMLALSNASNHAEFMESILKALQQIGDASAVPYVEQLAKALPTSARQRKVCDAARDCLEYVKLRSQLTRSSQTLLRASDSSATGMDMLVRPSNAVGLTDQEQLLRAGSGNGAG
jgi:hypothetical protein